MAMGAYCLLIGIPLSKAELAEVAGLEPANAGAKTPCLTTWRHPNIYLFCGRPVDRPGGRKAMASTHFSANVENFNLFHGHSQGCDYIRDDVFSVARLKDKSEHTIGAL